MEKKTPKIIIEGVTKSGETFRPSDWAERMSESLSTFRKHHIRYSPLLQPSSREGKHCVILDPKLKVSNPELYQSIMDFAENNNLKICKEDEESGSDE